jgi:hypothetical protein
VSAGGNKRRQSKEKKLEREIKRKGENMGGGVVRGKEMLVIFTKIGAEIKRCIYDTEVEGWGGGEWQVSISISL